MQAMAIPQDCCVLHPHPQGLFPGDDFKTVSKEELCRSAQ
jgi:hypothetical protein